MSTLLLEPRTYLPAHDDDLAAVAALLESRAQEGLALVSTSSGRADIPPALHELLVQVIAAMRAGRAVTLTTQVQRLTTQQAADMLGISRPTLVKLVDEGEIPCERHSSRRMIRLEDVMEYRKRRRERQLAAIAATSTDLDEDLDIDELRTLMREARRANARRRRSASR